MPRLRVDRDTKDAEIIESMHNLIAAGHVIDEKLTSPRLPREERHRQLQGREAIHREINRLITIMASRNARRATVA